MQVNLFSWIREGVRQSVLLGVSDAVEQIGSPQHETKFNKNLQELLQPPAEFAEPAGKKSTSRKRLGRSLKDLEAKKVDA